MLLFRCGVKCRRRGIAPALSRATWAIFASWGSYPASTEALMTSRSIALQSCRRRAVTAGVGKLAGLIRSEETHLSTSCPRPRWRSIKRLGSHRDSTNGTMPLDRDLATNACFRESQARKGRISPSLTTAHAYNHRTTRYRTCLFFLVPGSAHLAKGRGSAPPFRTTNVVRCLPEVMAAMTSPLVL